MKLKNIAKRFAVYFALTFIVSAVVGYLYGFIAHGHGVLDWESSFRFALIFGIILPIAGEVEHPKK